LKKTCIIKLFADPTIFYSTFPLALYSPPFEIQSSSVVGAANKALHNLSLIQKFSFGSLLPRAAAKASAHAAGRRAGDEGVDAVICSTNKTLCVS
jgi:hypothetical protein